MSQPTGMSKHTGWAKISGRRTAKSSSVCLLNYYTSPVGTYNRDLLVGGILIKRFSLVGTPAKSPLVETPHQ